MPACLWLASACTAWHHSAAATAAECAPSCGLLSHSCCPACPPLQKVEVAAFEADISQLQAMGFSRTAAMEALVEADNDMDTALELLCG